jgi:hypothetical protein
VVEDAFGEAAEEGALAIGVRVGGRLGHERGPSKE